MTGRIPVGKALKVLDIISQSETGLNVNEIIRRTGLKDKNGVIKCIDLLEKAEIIRTKKAGSQKQIKLFTELGAQLATLRKTIRDYDESYKLFIESVRRKLEHIDIRDDMGEYNFEDAALPNKLRAREWKTYETAKTAKIRAYVSALKKSSIEAAQFEIDAFYAFIFALCAKYIQLLFQTGSNERQRAILTGIFTDALQKHFATYGAQPLLADLVPLTPRTKEKGRQHREKLLHGLKQPAFNFIHKHRPYRPYMPYYEHIPLKDNKIIRNEARQMLNTINALVKETASLSNKDEIRLAQQRYREAEEILYGTRAASTVE